MPRNALRHHRRRERGPNYRPNFELDFDAYPPSVANLPAEMTINGTTQLPVARYKGGDLTTSAIAPWGYGPTLSITGSGTLPTPNVGSPLLGSVDDGAKFNGAASGANTGRQYTSAEQSIGDVGTDDFVAEFVLTVDTAAPSIEVLMTKYLIASGVGMQIYANDGTFVGQIISSGAVGPTSAAVGIGATVHAMLFMDRSGSGQWFINGVASGSATSIVGKAANSIVSAHGLTIGGYNEATYAGYYSMSGKFYYAALWHAANWLDTHLQATVAATRFAQLTGTYPLRAAGTALPTALTRSTTGYLDKVEADGSTKLYLMGANWPRCCSRLDSAGVLRKGLLVESAGTNSALQSEVAGTTWTCTDASIAASNSAAAPNGATTADTLTASANGGYLKQAFGTISAVSRTYSHWVQRNGSGNVAGILRLVKTSDESTIASTAFTATSSWQRISVTGTCVLNDTETRLIINTSGESLYVWGGQLETGPAPSSYVPTTTAAVTRTADVPPYYVANDGNVTAGRGALEVGFLAPSYDQAGQPTLVHLSDGTADNRIALHAASAGDDVVTLDVTAGTTQYAAVASTTDIYNGAHHKIRGTWNTNDARLLVDGTSEGTPDVTVTVPAGLTRIDPGGRLGAAGTECNGIITRLAVYR